MMLLYARASAAPSKELKLSLRPEVSVGHGGTQVSLSGYTVLIAGNVTKTEAQGYRCIGRDRRALIAACSSASRRFGLWVKTLHWHRPIDRLADQSDNDHTAHRPMTGALRNGRSMCPAYSDTYGSMRLEGFQRLRSDIGHRARRTDRCIVAQRASFA